MAGRGAGGAIDRRSVDRRPVLARRAESLAAEALERGGMRVLERNWRRPEGELDLVAALPDGTVVFCEVRSRTGEQWGDPLETIDARKRSRVVRAARHYLSSLPDAPAATGYRFDVVGVTFFPDDRAPQIVHIPAAFDTNG
jgi:putative endonuclease